MDVSGHTSGKWFVHIARVCGLQSGFLLNIHAVVGS